MFSQAQQAGTRYLALEGVGGGGGGGGGVICSP